MCVTRRLQYEGPTMNTRNAPALRRGPGTRLSSRAPGVLANRAARTMAMLAFGTFAVFSMVPFSSHAQTPVSRSETAATLRAEPRQQREQPPARWAPGSWKPWNDRDNEAASTQSSARTPVAPVQISPRELLQRADADLAAGRKDAAIDGLEHIVERFPASPEAATAKDQLVAQFRTARQQQSAGQKAKPSDPSPLKAGPQEVKVPPTASSAVAARPSLTGPAVGITASSAALRRGGDDFKLSVGDRIFFDAKTARIDAGQRNVLHAQAAWLRERPEAVVKIEGHADDPGPRELNAMLALERAEAVRAILIHEGVSTDRIEVIAAGNTRPVAMCAAAAGASDLCASQNRRVVTLVEWIDAGYRRRLSSAGGVQQSAAAGSPIGASRDETDLARTSAVRAPQPPRASQW